MKWNPKSFGVKLWLYFVLFAAIIFGALWLLQTVFLQSFYNGMAIKNVERIAAQIAKQSGNQDLDGVLDNLAYENSLLIFLTDWQGTILYSTDEHSDVYGESESQHTTDSENDNPYRDPEETLNWQIGAARYLNLPQNYDVFLQRLTDSNDGMVGYQLDNSSTYVYGMVLHASDTDNEDVILYISTALGAVGATVGILRILLVWVTIASLFVAFAIAFLISRRFAQPIAAISAQAKRLAEGDFEGKFEEGFCSELDDLSDTLGQTAAELAKTDSFRREFLANVSHDLRTPLTMIRGYAEMVRDISWEDEQNRETDLTIIIREADRLTGLVNDILEYTALQSEQQAMKFENVDISKTAQNIVAQFAPLCEHDGFNIEALIEPHISVYGNEQQLARVLYNLIDNAITHTKDNREIQVVLKDMGAVIRIEVRDFGNGIPQEELPYIWERYFTLKQKKRYEKGSGLGLAISKEILLAHGATFGAESEIGQGSTFWFELRKKEI